MHVHTRPSCLVCLAFLHVLPAVRAAQTCTQKFEGLTTCSTFNGAFASGSALSLNETKVLDLAFATAFDNPVNKDVKKSDQCRSLYNTFGCLRSVNAPTAAGGVQASAPCDSAGMRMKPCKALCLELTARCFPHKYKPMAEIDKECTDFSAPPDIECFGTNGVLGISPRRRQAHRRCWPPRCSRSPRVCKCSVGWHACCVECQKCVLSGIYITGIYIRALTRWHAP